MEQDSLLMSVDWFELLDDRNNLISFGRSLPKILNIIVVDKEDLISYIEQGFSIFGCVERRCNNGGIKIEPIAKVNNDGEFIFISKD